MVIFLTAQRSGSITLAAMFKIIILSIIVGITPVGMANSVPPTFDQPASANE